MPQLDAPSIVGNPGHVHNFKPLSTEGHTHLPECLMPLPAYMPKPWKKSTAVLLDSYHGIHSYKTYQQISKSNHLPQYHTRVANIEPYWTYPSTCVLVGSNYQVSMKVQYHWQPMNQCNNLGRCYQDSLPLLQLPCLKMDPFFCQMGYQRWVLAYGGEQ